MTAEKSPAFQCYAAEYLADINTQLMTIEEEGCYWRLMLFCWREKSLPRDIETLKGLCKGAVPSERVLACFAVRDDRLIHNRLEQEREKQAEWREKSAKGGRHSAHKPKKPKSKTHQQGGSRVVQPNEQGGSTLQSSSSSLSSSSNTTTPLTPQGDIGAATEAFSKFYDAYPRKENPLKAKEKFLQLNPDPILLAKILDWIAAAKESEQWQSKDKIPFPATFINQRRWEGDPPPKPCASPKKPVQENVDWDSLGERYGPTALAAKSGGGS